MKPKLLYLLASFAGIVCGVTSVRTRLSGSWTNLIYWGIVGVVLGLFAKDKKDVMRVGVIYGIFLTLSFILLGFQGSPDKLPGIILLTLILCIPGMLGGWLTVFIGSKLRRAR